MSSQTVARRYASALADVVTERGVDTVVQAELDGWEKLISENGPLLEAFSNPTVPYEQKGRLLEELLERSRVHQITANFLRVLLRNQRLPELPQVNARFADILDERSGVVGVSVTTARALSEETRKQLEQKLSELTGRKPRLTFATDEALVGGIVTRIGSTIYDGSVRDQLRRLQQELAG